MTPSSTAPDESRLKCYFIASIGFAVAGVSTLINARYGQRMSIDSDGWFLNGGLLLFLSLTPSFLAGYSGDLQGRGRYVKAALAFLAALILVSYSVWNANDFLSDQMLGKMRQAERKYESNRDISEVTNQEMLRSRRDQEERLSAAHKKEKDPAERRRLEDRLDQLRNEPLKLIAPSIDSTSVDNRSSWLSKQTGIDRETIQAISPTAGALLMALAELFLPWLGMSTLPGRGSNSGGLWARLRARLRRRGNSNNSPLNPRQFTKDEARQHLKALVSAGKGFSSNKEAAEAWRMSPQLAHKYLKAFRSEGIVRRQQQGRTKAVVAPIHHNGNGRVLGNA